MHNQVNYPLISIIIPTYNRVHVIDVAIASVLAQTYQNWECIVVDDSSTDDTLIALKAYQEKDSRIYYFERTRQPKGAPTCRNIGLVHAKGDYIIYLDSDDYLLSSCLKQRIEFFLKFPEFNFLVFPMGEKISGHKIIKREIPLSDNYLVNFLSANLPWSIMCPIWKTSFLKQVDGFTEGYPRFNDPEIMIRALLQPQVKFKVFNEANFDSVFIPSLKQPKEFKDKVYRSLILFIPDIANLLTRSNLKYKKYLTYYLHYWFRYVFLNNNYNNISQSLKLIILFKTNNVITLRKALSLFIRLIIYQLSKVLLKKPIDKISAKYIY